MIVGHTHAAFNYSWEGLRVFQVNNAKGENGTGNNDGNGSFSIVRVTDQQLDVVTCRWLDDQGHYELIGPYLSGPADPGRRCECATGALPCARRLSRLRNRMAQLGPSS